MSDESIIKRAPVENKTPSHMYPLSCNPLTTPVESTPTPVRYNGGAGYACSLRWQPHLCSRECTTNERKGNANQISKNMRPWYKDFGKVAQNAMVRDNGRQRRYVCRRDDQTLDPLEVYGQNRDKRADKTCNTRQNKGRKEIV